MCRANCLGNTNSVRGGGGLDSFPAPALRSLGSLRGDRREWRAGYGETVQGREHCPRMYLLHSKPRMNDI
jgi:hypothetical protein